MSESQSLFDALFNSCRGGSWLCIECWKLRFQLRIWRIYE